LLEMIQFETAFLEFSCNRGFGFPSCSLGASSSSSEELVYKL